MTLRSRRKLPTTAPTTRPAKSRISRLFTQWLTCCLAAGSLLSGPPPFLSAHEPGYAETRPGQIEDAAASNTPLRWKTRPIAAHSGATKIATGFSPIGSGVVQASHASDSSLKTAPAGGWNKMRIDTYVTPAQATSASDPFADPFGDRHATRASALTLQAPGGAAPGAAPSAAPGVPPASAAPPNTANPSLNPSLPPFNPNAANPPRPEAVPAPGNPAPFTPMPLNPSPLNPAPANPNPGTSPPLRPFTPNNPLVPPGTEVPPSTPMPPMPMTDPAPSPPSEVAPATPRGLDNPVFPNPAPATDVPCPERTYNDQNCCTSDVTCRAFIQGLMRDRLSNISLDITPRFQPDKPDSEDAELRDKQMSLSGVRDWHRRDVTFEQRGTAEPLVRGTLQNLTNGRAVIADESGATRTIPLNDLSEDDLCFISGWWGLPAECAMVSRRRVDLVSRGWTPSTINWTASALCHKPLYFEQVQHERYGHTAGPFKQPWIDGAHFFGSAIMLPYQMALDPPWECEYALGYYRPGSCAPWQIPPFPFSPRAALSQAGFVVGGIYIIP